MDITIKIVTLIMLSYSAYTDLKKREIMMMPIYVCILFSVIEIIVKGDINIFSFAGAFPGIFMIIVSHIINGAIGEGDAYLVLAVGLMVGLRNVIMILLLGSLFASVYSAIMLFLKYRNMKDTIAYAPFILSGFMGVMIFA